MISEAKKVENIEEKLTYVVFRYINKGLFVRDKMAFVLMICLKILIISGKLTTGDVGILLRSGMALDVKTEKPNPFQKWIGFLSLEQQLLGRVISKEKRTLEENLQQIMEDITLNTKTLLLYDKALLERLTSTQGNLLDDTELIEVLNNTKAKAREVQQKLIEAAEKQKTINE